MARLTLLFSLIIFSASVFAGGMDDEINSALLNAKKGISYGLTNLKTKKSRFDNTLIDQNKLIADVKVSKEINGIKIESTGYFNSVTVTVTVYRSYDSLVSDKFIDRIPESVRED